MIAWTSWATTVGEPWAYGSACVHFAMSVVESTRKPRIELMTTSVMRALWPVGLRNDATPFEIASRPVSDEPPLA